jgi:Fe-S cluster assembly protein SufB
MIYHFKAQQGLSKEVVRQISEQKKEPVWMTEFRLKALDTFLSMQMPSWGPNLSNLDFDLLCYYLKSLEHPELSWKALPPAICDTFSCLGLPEAEKTFLAGVGAQYESEVVYQQLRQEWEAQGVIFVDTDTALKQYPDLFKRYFSQLVPSDDNKFAALNAAVWSGGSFIYIPPDVQVTMPLQAYFSMQSPQLGQFERTIIVADKGSSVHYIEGCSARYHSSYSLHSAVVELYAHENAHIRYTTIQNWSRIIYNLVTKRACAYHNATIEWIDGNFGSAVTVKYPSIILKESGARGLLLSLSTAGNGQHQDTGGSMIHEASKTSSHILCKSMSKDGGCITFRGKIRCNEGVDEVNASMQCDSLLLDEQSHAQSIPMIATKSNGVAINHEASIGAIDQDQLFYCMSRGLDKSHARALIVTGFIDAFVKELPLEYAIEIDRIIGMGNEL